MKNVPIFGKAHQIKHHCCGSYNHYKVASCLFLAKNKRNKLKSIIFLIENSFPISNNGRFLIVS
jgi:hypothetical protein